MYLFLSFFLLLIYLFFIITVIFDNITYTNNFSTNFTILNSYLENINKSQMSLCLTNDVFLFGQEETVSVSTTPASPATSYKFLIFFIIVAIFSSIFYKKNYLKFPKQILPFLTFFLCFNSFPPHKSKSNDLKCCPHSEFFRGD